MVEFLCASITTPKKVFMAQYYYFADGTVLLLDSQLKTEMEQNVLIGKLVMILD